MDEELTQIYIVYLFHPKKDNEGYAVYHLFPGVTKEQIQIIRDETEAMDKARIDNGSWDWDAFLKMVTHHFEEFGQEYESVPFYILQVFEDPGPWEKSS